VLADVDTAIRCCLVRVDRDDGTAHRRDVRACGALDGPRRTAAVMALIGNGSQGEFQAIGFPFACSGIEEPAAVRTSDPSKPRSLVRNLESIPEMSGVKSHVLVGVRRVSRTDIVTTVTADKRNAIILTPPMVRPGMHLNAVGGDCPGKTELHPDILRRPARAWSSSTSRSRASRARSSSLEHDFPVVEFANVVPRQHAGRGGRER